MFTRKMLSGAERAEYDAGFAAACFDDVGEFRSTADATPLLEAFIRDAIQSHRTWAEYLHDSFTTAGYQGAVRRWQNEQRTHKTIIGGKLVTKQDAIRVSRRADDGAAGFQTSLIEDASAEYLEQLIKAASVRVASDRANIRDYMRLLDLMEQTGEALVRGALKRTGQTLDEFLTQATA